MYLGIDDSMKIAFTICSNNYLSQAIILGDSLIEHNPEYKFFVGLVDRFSSEIDYTKDIKHEILLVENIGIENFEELWKKYDIIELNTCVKPMYFKYLFNKFNADIVFYFDPDIMIFNSLTELENEFSDSSILLTPHILNPIPIDGKAPFENVFLNYGIYNLGFLGLKSDELSFNVLNWWQERTVKFGFSKAEVGLFVDQLWFNLVPLFFEKVKILKNLGYNMGPWNLHERQLTCGNNIYSINNAFKLTFFHFSNYKYTAPDTIAVHYNRYQLQDVVCLKKLYERYHHLLIVNKVPHYSNIACYFVKARENYKNEVALNKEKERIDKLHKNKKALFKHYIKKIIPPAFIRIYRAI